MRVIFGLRIGRLAGAMGTCASVPSSSSYLPQEHMPSHHVPSKPSSSMAVLSNGSHPEPFDLMQCGNPSSAFAADCSIVAPDAAVQGCDTDRITTPCFETHWRCDEGLMWPLEVNYSCQCSKGHTLSICSSVPCCQVCGGDGSVCMSCVECMTYGICALCLSSLKAAPPVTPTDGVVSCFLGVRPAFLKAFKVKWGHITRGSSTAQVCNLLVKSLTCRSRGSICEDLMQAQSCDVGQATLVLSHSWSNLFDDTVDAVLEVLEEERSDLLETVYIWFDVFSCRQHVAPLQRSASVIESFADVVKKAGCVAVVLHPFDDPLALKRLWCIFELFCCVRNGCKLLVGLMPNERERFAEQLESDVGSDAGITLSAFNFMLSKVDSRNASCTLPKDKAIITEALERDTEIENADDVVRNALLAWFSQQRLEPSIMSDDKKEQTALESAEVCEASTLFASAKVLHDSNMFSEGEQKARRAFELRLRVLGAENIDTKAAKLLLASLLKKQKKLDEAIPMYQEMLAASRQLTGVEHEETLACMNNLAVLLKQNGKLDDAQALYEEALHVKRIKLGVLHSSTLTSMSNLAGLLKAQGKYAEARVLYEESLQGHKSVLGPQHPDTLTDMWNFALFLNKVNEPDAAASLLRECYDGWQRVLGHDHLNTIMCKKAMVQLGIS